MSGKLKQRGLLALIIYFLMITAIWTPIGFYAGVARGESEARPASGEAAALSQPETIALRPGEDDETAPARPITGSALTQALPHAPRSAGPRSDTSLRQNPLREAVLRALADDAVAGDSEQQSSPLSLALAPEPGGFGASFGEGGSAAAPNGYPGAIIPGFLQDPQNQSPDPDPPPPGGEDPPVIITPAPGALPLLLTGLAGFGFAARGRRTG